MNVPIPCWLSFQTVSPLVPGDSVGSDTGLGYGTDTELSLSPWQTYEEDPDLNTPTDAVTDSDARHWLQLSPTDASHVTGTCDLKRGAAVHGWGIPWFPRTLGVFQHSDAGGYLHPH